MGGTTHNCFTHSVHNFAEQKNERTSEWTRFRQRCTFQMAMNNEFRWKHESTVHRSVLACNEMMTTLKIENVRGNDSDLRPELMKKNNHFRRRWTLKRGYLFITTIRYIKFNQRIHLHHRTAKHVCINASSPVPKYYATIRHCCYDTVVADFYFIWAAEIIVFRYVAYTVPSMLLPWLGIFHVNCEYEIACILLLCVDLDGIRHWILNTNCEIIIKRSHSNPLGPSHAIICIIILLGKVKKEFTFTIFIFNNAVQLVCPLLFSREIRVNQCMVRVSCIHEMSPGYWNWKQKL